MISDSLKDIVRGSYYHLLTIFVILVFLLQLGVVRWSTINFYWFAVVLGTFGISLKKKRGVVPKHLLYIAIVGSLILRIIPYINNPVPLGYDPGLYKFVFEQPLAEQWTKNIYPLPFSLVMHGLQVLFGSWFLMVPLFIVLSASTSLVVYQVAKKLFDTHVGVVAALLFMVSITQFETFWYMYYKNVIGIMLLLVSYLYFDSKWLIAIGVAIAGVHRPAFFLFGVTYFMYVMLQIRQFKEKGFWERVGVGAVILGLAFVANVDRIIEYMLRGLVNVGISFVELSGGAGTFYGIEEYVFYSLPFVPFAITGLLHFWKKSIPLFISTTTVSVMVLLELFFHNRFIIYLDIFMIMYAALGFLVLMKTRYGRYIFYSFLVLMTVLAARHALDSRPLISKEEFAQIQSYKLPANATVMVTDQYYSPWIKGWVDRPIVAPGLFDENRMNRKQWRQWWSGNRTTYMQLYDKPLYVHVGERQYQFKDVCFEPVGENIFLYVC